MDVDKTHVAESAHVEVPSTIPDIEKDQLAALGNQEEHELTKWQSLKRYPSACFWCIYAVWCVLLVSFENQAAGSILSIPEFRKDFGSEYDGDYVLPADWQSAFSGAPIATAMIGALGCGALADWFGRRMVIMIALVISFAAITLEFVATTNPMFFGGKFLNGFALGALASVTVTYIGEITPLALRGPFVAALIVNSMGTYNNRWAYRAVFCAQYGFAVVASVFVFFMPESPWWLASKDRDETAMKALSRLGHKNEEEQTKKLAIIHTTLKQARQETEGASYLECFRKSNLRRTCVSIAPLCIQALSGVTFVATYSTYYMQLAGYDTPTSFKLQVVQQVLSLTGNIMSWYLVDRAGRRDLTFWGLVVLTVILMLTGGLAVAADNGAGRGAVKGTVALILIYCWWYNVTIGATAYTVLCEVPTAKLRVKTIGLGLAAQFGLQMMWNFVLPYLFNPDQANLGAKLAFIFGGLAVISLVYLWFELPESAGRTYEELDEMFAKRIPARQFKSYHPEAQMKGEAAKVALSKSGTEVEEVH